MSRRKISKIELFIVTLAASLNLANGNPQFFQNFDIFNVFPDRMFSRMSCESFWSLQNYNSEIVGIISIPHPDQVKSEIRAVLSVATQLPSVS